MSYLGPLRLHFAGQFQATVSTVNNDAVHFDNSRFLARYQDPGDTGNPDPAKWNGWFNPRGDANWRLLGCAISDAWVGPGAPAGPDDPVRTCLVADSDRAVSAKLVDLDPAQQMVSTIFGLEVRIVSADGATTLVRGLFDPAPFTDIWSRSEGRGEDNAASATYQSVLTDVEWGEVSSSAFLTQMRESATDGLLSIKFNVDLFNMDFASPDFMRGRIVGTIGPARADEPRQLTLGRHFLATSQPTQSFFLPAGNINFCVARVDPAAKRIYLDLGNALPTTRRGDLADLGLVTLICLDSSQTTIDSLASTSYTDPAWYSTTAGVVELPAARELTTDEMIVMASNPLAIVTTDAHGTTTLAIAEAPGGQYLRADRFVWRMSPGEREHVRLYATQFGQGYAGARVVTILDPTQLQPGSPLSPPDGPPVPNVATPETAVDFPARVIADDQGVAVLPIRAADPGNPRGYIDGQVYGVRPVLEETVFSAGAPYPFNPSDFISLLVWDDFDPGDKPITWWGTLQPILQQYENLYPVMKRFVQLGDYDSVCEHARFLLLTFGLDQDNPNSMPVTRDLSPAKRSAIVRWLSEPDADGKPLKGTPPAAAAGAGTAAAPPTAGAAEVAPGPPVTPAPGPAQGGKAAAAGRRLGLRAPTIGPAGSVIGRPR